MRIWDGMRVMTKHDYAGVVRGEAVPGEYTGRPVITVELDRAYATFSAGDTVKYLTSDVRVTGRAR